VQNNKTKGEVMFKRVLMFGLLSVSLVALLETGAEAHYLGYIAGIHYSSINCTVSLKQVPSLDAHPAETECTVTTGSIEILCKNPKGNLVAGESATPVTLVAQAPVEQTVAEKKKGKAHVAVHIDDTPLLDPQFCVNPNWIPVAVLTRSLTSEIKTYACVGPDTDPCSVRELASTVDQQCELPAQYNFNNYPNNLPPIGTPYDCPIQTFVHVD
jgi:hypothetical protein